jgi:uncharacterized OsmC-like protein
LAAIAGCSSIDVDTVTARSAETTSFKVAATGEKVDEDGATRMDGHTLTIILQFQEAAEGRKAAGMVERLVDLSHEKYCTVSRTVERGTPVTNEVHVELGDAEG